MFKSSTGGGTAFAGIEKKLSGGSPDDPGVPPTVRKAVRFMFLGAAVTVVTCLFQIVVTIVDKNLIDVNGKPPSSSQLTLGIVVLAAFYAVYVALWLLMARYTRAGQNWARIVSSVLFAISTWQLYSTINSLQAGVTITVADVVFIVLSIAIWIAGVGAVALLWRAESSRYFKGLYAPRR